jgi:hypothetical protein
MAAGQDGGRVQALRRAGIGLGGEPAFKLPAREKPFAAKLCGGQLLGARKLIKRAFGKAEETRGFLKRQNIRHLLANFGKNRHSVKRHGELTQLSPIRI